MGSQWERERDGQPERRPEQGPQRQPGSRSTDQPRPLQLERRRLRLPLASDSVAAGFPSPADDYIDTGIDLNEVLIRHPSSTFFLRVSGDSMTGAGIQHGDLLVVDRSLEARPGRIVVAVLDGAFTLKRLARHQGRLRLEAANSAYPPLELHRCGDVQIWGVAIHVIHSLSGHG